MNQMINELRNLGNKEKAASVQRYFKTGKGEYAQGDIFWGVTVLQVRTMARTYKYLSADQIEKLLDQEVYEVRLCALLMMVAKSKELPEAMYNL